MNTSPHKRPGMSGVMVALLSVLGLCMVAAFIHTWPHTTNAGNTPLEVAKSAAAYGKVTDGGYDAKQIIITDTLPLASYSQYQYQIKEDCFTIERAEWQRYPNEQVVQVTVEVPGVNSGTVIAGVCTMKWANAHYNSWADLTAESAWGLYDSAYFSPAISP